MRQDFFTPYLKGSKIFYIQVKVQKSNLLDSYCYVIEFENSSIESLKNDIKYHCKAFELKIIECSDLYTMRTTIKYDRVNGFNLIDDLKEREVML